MMTDGDDKSSLSSVVVVCRGRAVLSLYRRSSRCCSASRWWYSDGPHCISSVRTEAGHDSNWPRNPKIHSSHNDFCRLSWCVVFHRFTLTWLLLAGCCHLPHRHHCRQCSWRTSLHCHRKTQLSYFFDCLERELATFHFKIRKDLWILDIFKILKIDCKQTLSFTIIADLGDAAHNGLLTVGIPRRTTNSNFKWYENIPRVTGSFIFILILFYAQKHKNAINAIQLHS